MRFLRFAKQKITLLGVAWSIFSCSGAELSAEMADFRNARIEFLDVGQGLSILMQADGEATLYDAGNDSANFWDTLRSRNVTHLDWALISHWHRDHAGGFLEWDAKVSIDTLFYSNDPGGTWLRDSVFNLAKRFGTPTVQVERGRELPCAEWTCKILWPTHYVPLEGNNASAVLQISDGKFRMLLTGDLEALGESELLEISNDIQAELLQVGHHGSATSSSLRFLEQVSPSVAVISVGKKNRYGHPSESTLNKLYFVTGDSTHVFRTDLLGSIPFEWNWGKGLWEGNY